MLRGTESTIVYVALSDGWSLLGNHQAAIWGSPTAMAPVRVFSKGVSPPYDSPIGLPRYSTVTAERCPRARAFRGRTTSSCWVWWKPARLPFTVTDDARSRRSRLNLLSRCLGTSVTVVLPDITCVSGCQAARTV